MKIDSFMSDDAILRELGARLARVRLDRNITQADLATQAGVSKRTIERLESGEVGAQLSVVLRVCRVLGLIERLEAFLPAPTPSPIEQLKLRGRLRRRASGSRVEARVREEPWTWGESA